MANNQGAIDCGKGAEPEIAFHRTGVYRYFGVPLHLFEGLRDASSQRGYMRACVIDVYPWDTTRYENRFLLVPDHSPAQRCGLWSAPSD